MSSQKKKKMWKLFIPVQAEAEGINWATLQVVSHGIESVIVKSDAKICVDVLICRLEIK